MTRCNAVTKKSANRRQRDAATQLPAVVRAAINRADGSQIIIPEYIRLTPRARHLLRAVSLKRKMLADCYRYIRSTAEPEKRAEMRKQLMDSRRIRKGWANV
jgi:hypothetical protein